MTDAEREIERLIALMPAARGFFIEAALRAAMLWAYKDAAAIVEDAECDQTEYRCRALMRCVEALARRAKELGHSS